MSERIVKSHQIDGSQIFVGTVGRSHKTAKDHPPIASLSVGESRLPSGTKGVYFEAIDEDGHKSFVNLYPRGALEVVKGFLQNIPAAALELDRELLEILRSTLAIASR